ncbi:hypothetical protein [Streptomyces sp. SID13031]|uniref:hypothetical protein n=1 Tax=Streptomyces sp. SID13031 TaxID=2706046 RepID=UPI0013C6E69C|nr:hypothetical protein [Streptomyces sp. SID13031]NEA32367.1 hypothetical protein [Streptomyces sp. SID13031]
MARPGDPLRTELARWERELAALEDEYTGEGWTEPEKLLYTLQRTASIYRREVLPRTMADGALSQPAIPDSEAPAALRVYSAVITDEVTQLVDRLEELRLDLIRRGQTAQLELRAVETLAALRALGKVVLRFGREFEIPRLSVHPTTEQSEQRTTTAVHAAEREPR